MPTSRLIKILGPVLLAGCTLPGAGAQAPIAENAAQNPREVARVPGIIDYGDERTRDVIAAPDAVRVGEDFQVTVKTFGGGCEREGDTSVVVNETGATLMIYDITTATRPGVACTMILKRLAHTVTLRFTKPGEAVIRVWGRKVVAGLPPLGEPVVLERRVTVRPR